MTEEGLDFSHLMFATRMLQRYAFVDGYNSRMNSDHTVEAEDLCFYEKSPTARMFFFLGWDAGQEVLDYMHAG